MQMSSVQDDFPLNGTMMVLLSPPSQRLNTWQWFVFHLEKMHFIQQNISEPIQHHLKVACVVEYISTWFHLSESATCLMACIVSVLLSSSLKTGSVRSKHVSVPKKQKCVLFADHIRSFLEWQKEMLKSGLRCTSSMTMWGGELITFVIPSWFPFYSGDAPLMCQAPFQVIQAA